jgi:hypothetical protein
MKPAVAGLILAFFAISPLFSLGDLLAQNFN